MYRLFFESVYRFNTFEIEIHVQRPQKKAPTSRYYAPNFENVGGAYCFWLVRPCVRPCVCPSVMFFMHAISYEPYTLGF